MAKTAKAVTVLEIGADSPFLVPVSLKKISTSSDVTLERADASGAPLKQVYVSLDSGDEVPRDEIQEGIFRVKGSSRDKETWSDFAPISKEDLALIKEATSLDTFRIEHFIPLADVPFERATDAYFLSPPEGMTAKPLLLLASALKKTKRAGVFKLTKTSRQYLAVVYEKDGGLMVNTLAYAGDFAAVREAAAALDRQGADAKLSTAEKALAADLVNALGADADVLDLYEDELVPLRQDLVERALRGERLPKRERRAIEAPVESDLEDRLRATLAESASVPVGAR